MTDRKLYPVEIYLNEDHNVIIKQPDPLDDGRYIVLHPSQVDEVIKWLGDVKAEAEEADK